MMEELKKLFRPEFLNRIDDIIVFKPLSKEDLLQIVNIQLDLIQERLKEKRITLLSSQEVKEYLVAEGYDIVYGARPLKRIIQTNILNKLAMEILEGKISEGDSLKVVLNKEKEINFKNLVK